MIRQLKDHMPIERAKMKLKVTAPAKDTKKVMEKMKQLNCQIEEESHDPDLILVNHPVSEMFCKLKDTCTKSLI